MGNEIHIYKHLTKGRWGKTLGIDPMQKLQATKERWSRRNSLLQRRIPWLVIQYYLVSLEKHTSSVIQMQQVLFRNICVNLYAYMHVITINKKEGMNLQENKKQVYGRFCGEERKGGKWHNHAMSSKLKKQRKVL